MPLGTSLLATRYVPYQEAIECSIFMSEYAPPPTGRITQRRSSEKKAIAWAQQGFKQLKHLLTPGGNEYINIDQFITLQRPPRIALSRTALQEAIKQIPTCLQKAILRGP